LTTIPFRTASAEDAAGSGIPIEDVMHHYGLAPRPPTEAGADPPGTPPRLRPKHRSGIYHPR
jgi:hypothetical protein